jgi:hypothetical protein
MKIIKKFGVEGQNQQPLFLPEKYREMLQATASKLLDRQ